jgi:peptidoglycan-associated lipoprotein
MLHSLSISRISLLSVFLAASACSSGDKNNQLTSAPLATPARSNSAVKDQRVNSGTVREAQGSSSLDALRRGEGATTPAGSPLKEIFFEFDRYDLSADARATLKAASEWLKQNPTRGVDIEGHCDERGTTEYNLALGAKRAQAAKDYLASLGIAANRLSTTSYGEEVPFCREQSESCWQRNRRDRFVLISLKPGV